VMLIDTFPSFSCHEIFVMVSLPLSLFLFLIYLLLFRKKEMLPHGETFKNLCTSQSIVRSVLVRRGLVETTPSDKERERKKGTKGAW
jgi:hypothetical protein